MEHYLFSHIKKEWKVIIINASPNDRRWQRKIAHALWKINIFIKWNLYGSSFYKKLSVITAEDIVVFFMVEHQEPILNISQWLPSKTKKIVWFWNTINTGKSVAFDMQDRRCDMVNIRKCVDKVFTFDGNDALIYKINFYPQFYCMNKDFHSVEPEYDCYFIGNPRGEYRIKTMKQLENVFTKKNISFLFYYREEKAYIAYEENLENIKKCKCIVDISRENQSGLSLRPMEALFLNKKLITTNNSIINYDFYCKDNVFIWGLDDESTLCKFISSPIKQIPHNIIAKYDINQWVYHLLK